MAESTHEIGRRHRSIDGAPGGVVGAVADQRHRVHRVEAGLGPDGRRPALGAASSGERSDGEQVRDDLRLAGVLEVALGDPAVAGAGEEVDVGGVVDGEDGIETVVVGLDDRGPGGDELVVQDVAALGLLVAGQPDAEPVAAVGCVAAVPRRPHHRHRQRHAAGR